MRVVELWRYPVKSLQGERLDEATIHEQGVDGDRRWALFDADTDLGLTARRSPELLYASAHLRGDGSVAIALPDGSVAADDAALSRWLGRPVTLREADEPGSRTYENPANFEDEAGSPWTMFDGSSGAFHDSTRAVVSLVSTATIGSWDRRRFRSNVLLEGQGEDALVGSRVAMGSAVLDVGMRITRCVMTTRPQPGGIERDLDVLRRIHRERDSCLAVGALVAEPGVVRIGDVLRAASGEASPHVQSGSTPAGAARRP